MKKQVYIAVFAAMILASCEQNETELTGNGNVVTITASIGDAEEQALTRVATGAEGGTYSAFTKDDQFGIYATGGLSASNVTVTLADKGKWNTGSDLKWTTMGADAATISAYYPYQADPTISGYSILKSSNPNILEDVLVASRTNIVHGNPGIYLTFTHRFAMLCITLGSGFDGFSGDVTANVGSGSDGSTGIEATANIDGGKIAFKKSTSEQTAFQATKKGDKYYVIVPAEAENVTGDNAFKLNGITINGNTVPFESLKALTSNTIYNLTLYQLEGGTPVLRMGKIEQWAPAKYLGGIKGRPGIYTEDDLVQFSAAYKVYSLAVAGGANKETAGKALGEFGYYQGDDNGTNTTKYPNQWVIYLRNVLDMTLLNKDEYTFSNSLTGVFTDVFKGEGRAIGGLCINGEDADNVGFFGQIIDKARVENLTLADISVKGQKMVGALAGSINDATIQNCCIAGTSRIEGGVSGETSSVGGLVGYASATTLTRSWANATVISAGYITGGLVGTVLDGKVDRCFAKGNVTGTIITGGLIGHVTKNTTTLTNNYSSARVSGTEMVGGLIGITLAPVQFCYATGDVEATGDYSGGLIGETMKTTDSTPAGVAITGCSATGNVKGANNVGGLIGGATAGKLSFCFATGTITATNTNKGGLVATISSGTDRIDISYCYASNGVELGGSATNFSISYSYDTAGKSGVDANQFYSIDLTKAIPTGLLTNLNAEGKNYWTNGFYLIDGKGYALPVLTNGITAQP